MYITRNIPNLIGGISQQPAQSRLVNQCEDQLNYISTPASGLTTRPPLMYKSSVPYTSDGAFFILDRDADNRHNLWISPEGIHVETLDGEVRSVGYQDSALSYLALPLGADPRNSYRILPVADTCFIINRTVTVKADTNSYTKRHNQALVHIKQVAVSTTWSLTLDGTQVSFGYNSKADQSISTEQVASTLASLLLEKPAIASAYNILTAASVIHIERKNGAAFSVGLADTRGNTYSSLTTWKIKDFTDLPTIAPDGFTCCVTGANGDTSDDYYVRFRATQNDLSGTRVTWRNTGVNAVTGSYASATQTYDQSDINENTPISVGTAVSCTGKPSFQTVVTNISYSVTETVVTYAEHFPQNAGKLTYAVSSPTVTSLAHGVWEECPAPAQLTALDNTTMPHILVHNIKNDTWSFRAVTWGTRTAGDDTSAPFPSFVNKTLTAIFMFRNRLGLVAGDSVNMSAAGDLERFFPNTVQTLADDEPIDISVAVDDYSDILATSTVQDILFFWSKKRQYALSTPEVLSPKTAAILPSTAYTCMPDSGLPVCGSHIFFSDTNTTHVQLYEYAVDKASLNKEGISVTNHVPGLIPYADPVTLTASQTSSVAALFSAAAPNTVWLYQYYTTGDSKLQSAWSRHTFNGTIKNIAFRESVLWVEIIHKGKRVLGTLDFSVKPNRKPDDYIPALDFQIHCPAGTSTLPITFDSRKILVRNSVGEIIPYKKDTLPQTEFWAGEPFQRSYTFSKQYPSFTSRKESSVALTNARFQLKRWKLLHYETGPFTIAVINDVTKTTDYNVVQQRLGFDMTNRLFMETRQTDIPCRGRNTDITVTITSNAWTPETFLSADVEMNYINKTRIL